MAHTISIVAAARAEDDIPTDNRGWLDGMREFAAPRIELPAEDLAKRLNEFLATMGSIVRQLPATVGAYELDEMTLQVEISAKGQVSLLGTGGEVGATGGLSFTLRRQQVATPTGASEQAL